MQLLVSDHWELGTSTWMFIWTLLKVSFEQVTQIISWVYQTQPSSWVFLCIHAPSEVYPHLSSRDDVFSVLSWTDAKAGTHAAIPSFPYVWFLLHYTRLWQHNLYRRPRSWAVTAHIAPTLQDCMSAIFQWCNFHC
jgi:hypothetical protein